MQIRKTFTVSIAPEQHAFILDRLTSGRSSSVSEVVRAGLRLLEERDLIRTTKPTDGPIAARADAR